MLNKTIIGISQALDRAFGVDYKVFMDKVEKELTSPSFLIIPLNQTQEQKLGNRYELLQHFDIQYFPSVTERYTVECNEVAQKLFDVLEYIKVDGDLVRGTNKKAEIKEGILHFFIDFNMFVIKQQERINMGDIAKDVSLKESD